MGSGPSKQSGSKSDIENKQKSSVAGVGNSPQKSCQKRSSKYEVEHSQLNQHSSSEQTCLTSNKQIISDFISASSRNTQSQYSSIIEQLNSAANASANPSANASSTKLQYKDPSFPSQLSSLTKDIASFSRAKNLTWKRPAQFISAKGHTPCVFFKGVEPNDILQGDLGDCYFLSAIACLAERPGLIERLFEEKEINQNGCYAVWICHDGEWIQVVLDDSFPCLTDGGPSFTRSHDSEIWVLLLEKAYAKLYGSYDKIESGLAGHAIHDLTGAPYHYFFRESESETEQDEIWDVVQEYLIKGNYIVTASSENNTRGVEEKDDSGIVSNHSYSILDAREVVDNQGRKDRIVQIRNPWGQFEWKGDWSDKSSKWTAKTAQECGLQNSDDGIFWMNLRDFNDKFSQLMVAKVEEGFKYSSIKCSKSSVSEKVSTKVFTMRILNRMKCHIGITQKDKRNFATSASQSSSAYNYSLARLMVAKLESTSADSPSRIGPFVGSVIDCERDSSFEAQLEQGDYLVYIEVDWVQNDVRDLVLWTYAQSPVEFIEIQSMMGRVAESSTALSLLVDDLLMSHQESEDSERVHRYNDDVFRTSGSQCGYVYFLYENASNDVHIQEEISMKQSQNLKLCPSINTPNAKLQQVRVHIHPGEKQILKYRVDAHGRGEYSYQTQIHYILLQQVDPRDDAKLTQLALLQPSKVKQREMHSYLMKVFVHTFVFYQGVAFLYVNKTSAKTYVEDLQLEVVNLSCPKYDISQPIHIEVPPNGTKLITLLTIDSKQEIAYRPKMTFYLK